MHVSCGTLCNASHVVLQVMITNELALWRFPAGRKHWFDHCLQWLCTLDCFFGVTDIWPWTLGCGVHLGWFLAILLIGICNTWGVLLNLTFGTLEHSSRTGWRNCLRTCEVCFLVVFTGLKLVLLLRNHSPSCWPEALKIYWTIMARWFLLLLP